ncbi:hypothetical protein DPMN_061301 [Dreissena polymorpha]|uniref:Uncharacterized protein n=1 Tax=Dreissena polymorpha TaxID=45954 RepID=A0A9D4C6R6_DREPO|nr:hypothetical protein DPMN_061301 [Dreissena polymorpha]
MFSAWLLLVQQLQKLPFHNYNGLVDADYKFIQTEKGSNGSAADAKVSNNSELKETIDKGVLNLRDPEQTYAVLYCCG